MPEKGVGELPLKVGDKGEGVRIVHQQLAALGYIMQSDKDRDIYDDWTAGKVKQFQQDQMIRTQNGVYDYYTARAFAQVLDVYRKHWLETSK
ncbi:peptidoglycan-binding domain-containing protein [Bacillus sp. JJ1562]|uniref:peptidoglycan-binding domain-containing protein n=1 Tax=Bacillus sp. JJ1562 TaxID=3122960 RepID=UPI0030023E0F